MMDRRRALMGAKKETALKIKDVDAGAEFRFSETGTSFIYLGVINGAAWLLRDQVLQTGVKMRTGALCDYENSAIDTYLSTTWIDSFSQKSKDAMADTTVTFQASDGTALSSKSITRKAFLLSRPQVETNENSVLSALKKYKNTTSGNTARIARDSGGTERAWWTCTAISTTNMCVVATSGSTGTAAPNNGSGLYYRRPVLSINKETEVKLVNGVYVMA